MNTSDNWQHWQQGEDYEDVFSYVCVSEFDANEVDEEVEKLLNDQRQPTTKRSRRSNLLPQLDEKNILESIEKFCAARDDFFAKAGLSEFINSKSVKRISTNLLQTIHIFTEFDKNDIMLINKSLTAKNLNGEGEIVLGQVQYEAVDAAKQLIAEMNDLVEKIYFFFDRLKIFKKIAFLFSSSASPDEIKENEDEVKSIFSQVIYTILMRVNTLCPISYIYLWLKTAVKREFAKSIVSGAPTSSKEIVSLDYFDENSERNYRSLHERLGFTVDFDGQISQTRISNLDYFEDDISRINLRSRIFYEANSIKNIFNGKRERSALLVQRRRGRKE